MESLTWFLFVPHVSLLSHWLSAWLSACLCWNHSCSLHTLISLLPPSFAASRPLLFCIDCFPSHLLSAAPLRSFFPLLLRLLTTSPSLPSLPFPSLMSGSPSTSGAATAVSLSREEEKEFREIFNLVDRDKGGSISKAELQSLMDTLAINASQQEIDLMIGEIDKNNDGKRKACTYTYTYTYTYTISTCKWDWIEICQTQTFFSRCFSRAHIGVISLVSCFLFCVCAVRWNSIWRIRCRHVSQSASNLHCWRGQICI